MQQTQQYPGSYPPAYQSSNYGQAPQQQYPSYPQQQPSYYPPSQQQSGYGQNSSGYGVPGHVTPPHQEGGRLVSVHQRVDESRAHVVGERCVEHEVVVPKKIIREDVIEKVVVIPERVINEEIVEEIQTIKERIIEVSKPIIVEKIVEVPEYEYVERIVEVPEKIYQEKIKEVEKIEYQERINEIVKVIPQERVVEVPDIQYREVPYERVVHVPEIVDEIVYKEVPVPQYVDKPVPNLVQVEKPQDVNRHMPVMVEANVMYEYRLPKIKPKYNRVSYQVFLPRFIEIPVAVELLDAGLIQQTEEYLEQVNQLTKSAASLAQIEGLATRLMQADMASRIDNTDLKTAVLNAWHQGSVQIESIPQQRPSASASSAQHYQQPRA